MKSKDVLQLLQVSRATLYKYVKNGSIKVTELENGYYDYDKEDVMKLLKKDNRKNVLYARISTYKQKSSLVYQIEQLKEYCKNNNIEIHNIYQEVSSGIDLDRKELNNLLNEVMNFKIRTVYITTKDRLSKLSFKTLEKIFNKYQTDIVIINEDNEDENELFNELISLIHIFSTSMYNSRKKKKLSLVRKDLENYIEDD